MKKALSLLALFTLSITIIGCTPANDEDTFTLTLESDYEAATLEADPEGPYTEGDTVTVSATWDSEDAEFIRWESGGVSLSEDASFEYTVEEDATLEAVFDMKAFIDSIDLSSNMEGVAFNLSEDSPFEVGNTVTITPQYNEDTLSFIRWELNGSEHSTTEALDYEIAEGDSLEAIFEDINTVGSLDITANVDGVTFSLSEDSPYVVGETVSITPEYNAGTHTFVHWKLNGSEHSTTEALEYTVGEGDSLEAVFELSPIEPQIYEETFENYPETGSSYQSGTFTGDHDIEWTYTGSRGDKNIDGTHALTFGDASRNPSLTATIDEGIHSFSIDYLNAFTGDAELALYINGNLIAESGAVNNETGIFEVEDINISGTFELELIATNSQTIIDNMVWENYVEGSDYPEVTMESTYWDAEMHALPSTKVEPGSDITVTASDPTSTYTFLEWQDSEGNTLSTDSEYTFTLNEDTTVVSVFDNPERYDLDLNTNLYNAEMTSSEASPIIDGTEVSLEVTYPSGPHAFLGWYEGDTLVSDQEAFDYTVENDTTLEARFDVPEDYDTMSMEDLLAIDMYSEYDPVEDMYGTNLETALQSIVSQMTGVTYDDARIILDETDQDPDNPDNLILIYTRMSTSGEWGGSWNREHVWPQSLLGVDTNGDDIHEGTDLHNLAPANPGENSARGNLHFGVDGYMPPEEVRGDVARMLFYMDVRYDGLSLVDGTPSTHEMGDLETLIEWHLSDPVSDFEYNRNDVIEDYQGNRNPFIDYPHLAYLLYHDHSTVNLTPPTN